MYPHIRLLFFKVPLQICVISIALLCACTREQQLERRAKAGDVYAMHELAMANTSPAGGGIVRDPRPGKALALLREAAGRGFSPAMYTLSQLLTDDLTNEERVMWLKKGAELGSKACLIELRNAYEHGMYGLPKDAKLAAEWQQKVRDVSEEELRRQGYIVPPSK